MNPGGQFILMTVKRIVVVKVVIDGYLTEVILVFVFICLLLTVVHSLVAKLLLFVEAASKSVDTTISA